MDLIPWRRKDKDLSLRSLQKDMNRLFENFFGSGFNIEPVFSGWSPALDISETEEAVIVKVELPGVEPKDIDISHVRIRVRRK